MVMKANTSVSLGSHFEQFVDSSVAQGRYKNASEVIRAGLRLLEEEDEEHRLKVQALREAIQHGLNSGIARHVDRDELLASFKAKKALRDGAI